MINSFFSRGDEDLFNGRPTKAARKTLPVELHRIAGRKLDQLDAAVSLESLKLPKGNHLEALKGDRAGQHSIRINDKYRICFRWTATGPSDVEITDYH